MNRNTNLEKLKNEYFDVCIIGAGASGAGVALDAILRGYSVAIIDKGDFAGQTSSKSTKLIHGGVRYLEQAIKEFDPSFLKQVIHGLRERRFLLSNAPHLTKPLAIITPVFSWIEGLYFSIGLKMYGWFAKNDTMPSSKWLSKAKSLEFSPDLNPKIHSSVMYYDGQINDAKFALALVQSMVEKGGVAANYVEFLKFNKTKNGSITSINVCDLETKENFEIKSKIFVNCTGPFSDQIRLLANPTETPRVVPSKGVHFMMNKSFFDGEKAMLIPKTKDGRLVFVIPFQGEILVGTTDTEDDDITNEPILLEKEAEFLIETLRPFLAKIPTLNDIRGGFGGLRPLLEAKTFSSKDTKSLLRDHEVELDRKSGLISLLGGKWTTYRLMAEDTTNLISKRLDGSIGECLTHNYKLIGAQNEALNPEDYFSRYPEFSKIIITHLWQNYGDQLDKVIEFTIDRPDLKRLIHPKYPYILAEVAYCCKHEMIVTLRDFFARRIRLELLDWQTTAESIPVVAGLMALELEWSQEKLEKEKSEYLAMLEIFEKSAHP